MKTKRVKLMNNITPEMTKVVAEGMGYRHVSINETTKSVTYNSNLGFCSSVEYNPLENPAQDREIEIKLIELFDYISYERINNKPDAFIDLDNNGEIFLIIEDMVYSGDTPAEARFMALYNYLKEVNSDEF